MLENTAAQETGVREVREQIEIEYQAALLGLSGYAITARHDFISHALEVLADGLEQLNTLVDRDTATELIATIMSKEIDTHAE